MAPAKTAALNCLSDSPTCPFGQPSYLVRRTLADAGPGNMLPAAAWRAAETARVEQFLPQSSAHRPPTEAQLLYSSTGLHGIFRVQDRYVRCVRTNYFDRVYQDSCVEFFVQPRPDKGYFNFEFNCGGAYLCNYVIDSTLVDAQFKAAVPVPRSLGKQISVKSSLPPVVNPELTEPVLWTLQFFIPFRLLEEFVGSVGLPQGQVWRGNFYKCATEVSHPH